MEAISRRMWGQDGSSSPPSSANSSVESCGVGWDVKVASPVGAGGTGNGSPGSSKFDESWPSRSEGGADSGVCGSGAIGGEGKASSSVGVAQCLDEGVAVPSLDLNKDLEREEDSGRGGSTLAK